MCMRVVASFISPLHLSPKLETNHVSKLSLEKDLYINRHESVILSTEMCILETNTYWKVGTIWN